MVRHHLPFESQHLFGLTVLVGIVCGLVAVAFHLTIRAAESLLIDRALAVPGNGWIAWTLLSPTLGGLAAGLVLTYVVPGARGSGIPQVKASFALEGGRVRFRDAFGKFWLASLQIGSGASLGREGPTVQICAGATSLLARLTGLPAKNVRRMLPVGVAAGIAAAFNAPIAAVTFTIEEIVGGLDHAVLSGVVVAAALAAVIERGVLGIHPVIEVTEPYGLDHPSSLVFFAVLGIAGGVVSIAFTDALLGLRQGFRDLRRLPQWAHPAVGGLVTGVLAVAMLKLLGTTGVTGGGYETLGKALLGKLGIEVLLALGAAKLVATVFSYSSGGAGGIFAPALFIGAMLGGAVGYLDVVAFGHEQRQMGAFALVGMGAVFAGVIRAPITSVLIIFEMTGGYGLVLPLMLSNMTAYVLARRFRPTPIYDALLAQDGIALPHPAARPHPLEQLTVADAMSTGVVTVDHTRTVGEVRAQLAGRAFELVPVVDSNGAVVGAASLSAISAAVDAMPIARLVQQVETMLAEAPLTRAVVAMNDRPARQLLVVDAGGSRLVGVLTITDLVRAHARAAGGATPDAAPAHVPSTGPENLRADGLARAAIGVDPGAPVDALLRAIASSPSGVAVVRGPDGTPGGVVLIEHVRDLISDPQLLRMLVAEDLVRPALFVAPGASLAELVAACVASDCPALIVEGPPDAVKVVTRAALGAVLLDWYAGSVRG